MIWRYALEQFNEHDELGQLPIYTIADVSTWKNRPSYLRNLVLEGPYSRRRVSIHHSKRPCVQPFSNLMNSCRISRLLGLEYWQADIQHFLDRMITNPMTMMRYRKKGLHVPVSKFMVSKHQITRILTRSRSHAPFRDIQKPRTSPHQNFSGLRTAQHITFAMRA